MATPNLETGGDRPELKRLVGILESSQETPEDTVSNLRKAIADALSALPYQTEDYEILRNLLRPLDLIPLGGPVLEGQHPDRDRICIQTPFYTDAMRVSVVESWGVFDERANTVLVPASVQLRVA